jgi:hypothetical protein
VAPPQTLVFRNRWALGDTVVLAALVRDIHLAHPGRFAIRLYDHYTSYWKHCPHAQARAVGETGRIVELGYQQGITAAGRGEKIHFLTWFHRDFKAKTGITVPVTQPRGEIYLSAKAKVQRPVPHRYWVVVAGGKTDMTGKVWYAHRWQETIDALAARGIRCVQAGARFDRHFHPILANCESFIGKTDDIHDFFQLIAHADGVICGVTGAMHAAAAFEKPCVVIAGGREEPWWEAYRNDYKAFGLKCPPVRVEHVYLHTIGQLDCGCGNLAKGCWRDRVVPLDQEDHRNTKRRKKLCLKPNRKVQTQVVPECLAMITTDQVVAGVMGYYDSGVLAPPDGPVVVPKTVSLPVVVVPPEVAPLVVSEKTVSPTLDHPHVGGKFTVFVLGFGDHLPIVSRCLESILSTCPPERIDLRVALNQPSAALLDYVHGYKDILGEVYLDQGKRRKYPAMRAMFHDKDRPIETKYVVWFDDDSHAVKKDWLSLLAAEIAANHAHGCRLYGVKFVHSLMTYKRQGFHPEKWFQASPAYKGRPFLHGGVREAPNGSDILFVTGGFWALATEALKAADIPDPRLSHNGGDITLGFQVQQAGYKIKDFCRGKTPIRWSDAPRRGYREDFPWSKFR